MNEMFKYNFNIYQSRWEKGIGDTLRSQTQTFWQTNEPNLADFDFNERGNSPLSKQAVTACGNNPTSNCAVSQSYSCISTDERDEYSFVTGFVNPTNSILWFNNPATKPTCPSGLSGCQDSTSFILKTNKVIINACSNNDCSDSAIFLNLNAIKNSTSDSGSSCIAMYGSKLNDDAASGQTINTCSPLLQEQSSDSLLGKWTDVDCSQRTLSLICDLGRHRISYQLFLRNL